MNQKDLDVRAIVARCSAYPKEVTSQFGGGLDNDDLKAAVEPRNWVGFHEFEDCDWSITDEVRGYDCAPFDDQLRAYVTGYGENLTVKIQGE